MIMKDETQGVMGSALCLLGHSLTITIRKITMANQRDPLEHLPKKCEEFWLRGEIWKASTPVKVLSVSMKLIGSWPNKTEMMI